MVPKDQWNACPYQRFFERYNQNRQLALMEIKLDRSDRSKTHCDSSPHAGNSGENTSRSSLSSSSCSSSVSHLSMSNRQSADSDIENDGIATNDDSNTAAAATTEAWPPFKGFSKSKARNTLLTEYCRRDDYATAGDVWEDKDDGPIGEEKDIDDDDASFEMTGIVQEPEEFDIAYDDKNRPKLTVLTNFLGGF